MKRITGPQLTVIMCKTANYTNYMTLSFLILNLVFLFSFGTLSCVPEKSSLKNFNRLENHQNNNLNFNNSVDHKTEIKNVEIWIKARANDFNIPNLKESELSKGEKELRIWAGLGQGKGLNCFILLEKDNEWKATLLTIYMDEEEGGIKKTRQGDVLVNKRILPSPKSGWEKVNSYLKEKGVRVPVQYSWDKKSDLVEFDERSITLELKEKENYDVISYSELTQSIDGKNVMDVCNYLSREFDILIFD